MQRQRAGGVQRCFSRLVAAASTTILLASKARAYISPAPAPSFDELDSLGPASDFAHHVPGTVDSFKKSLVDVTCGVNPATGLLTPGGAYTGSPAFLALDTALSTFAATTPLRFFGECKEKLFHGPIECVFVFDATSRATGLLAASQLAPSGLLTAGSGVTFQGCILGFDGTFVQSPSCFLTGKDLKDHLDGKAEGLKPDALKEALVDAVHPGHPDVHTDIHNDVHDKLHGAADAILVKIPSAFKEDTISSISFSLQFGDSVFPTPKFLTYTCSFKMGTIHH